MNNMFYPKLALSNIKKNGKFYFPYIITCLLTIAMFYIMDSVGNNKALESLPSALSLILLMRYGTVVIGIFSVLFLFYTNSFLMKRRKKELGLYNILGMEKRHLCKVLFFETAYMTVGCIGLGLLSGMLLDKLLLMVLYRMIHIKFQMEFSISLIAVAQTVVLFVGIFFVILVSQFVRIAFTKPIDLLKGGNVGEKEPKAKWFIAIIGLVCLGVGYYISFTTKDPLAAISLFFVAVVLVIIGTYLLFTAGSIVILKLLKKNKKIYYKTKYFTTISGMLYRMKQNAVGLGNIAILSTMVLVVLSATICLYIGAEDMLHKNYPNDAWIRIAGKVNKIDQDGLNEELQKVYDKYGAKHKGEDVYKKCEALVEKKADGLEVEKQVDNLYGTGGNLSQSAFITFLSRDSYQRVYKENIPSLAENEVAVYTSAKQYDTYSIGKKKFICKEVLKDCNINDAGMDTIIDTYYIIVKDDEVLQNMFGRHTKMSLNMNVDYGVSKQQQAAFEKEYQETLCKYLGKKYEITVEFKTDAIEVYYSVYGGFMFLGAFLGVLFILAATLIIYYKQISEGYDDKDKFEIMEKVGMTRKEVKQSIRTQVLLVFFLPLIVACVHLLAAYPLLKRLLLLFGLQNTSLFVVCMLGTIAVFSLAYGVVYTLTARVYYKIVS